MGSVSILVLSLNEVGNIERTVKSILSHLERAKITDWEIIFVDAASTDGTQEKIIKYVLANPEHFKQAPNCRGLGIQFRTGVACASKEYVGWFPADNETVDETMKNIFLALGKADMIVPYTVNVWARTLFRRILSWLYTTFVQLVYSVDLKYFNGPCFFRRKLLEKIPMTSNGLAYMAEILVQGHHLGASSAEVEMYIRPRDYGASSVVTFKNVWPIAATFARLFWRVRIQGVSS